MESNELKVFFNEYFFESNDFEYLVLYIVKIDIAWMRLFNNYPPDYLEIFKSIRRGWELTEYNFDEIKTILRTIFTSNDEIKYINNLKYNTIVCSKEYWEIYKVFLLVKLFIEINPCGPIENSIVSKILKLLDGFPLLDSKNEEQNRIISQSKKIKSLQKIITEKDFTSHASNLEDQLININTQRRTQGGFFTSVNSEDDEDEDEDMEENEEEDVNIEKFDFFHSKSLIDILNEKRGFGEWEFVKYMKRLTFNIRSRNNNYFFNWIYDSYIPMSNNIFNALYCYTKKKKDYIFVKRSLKSKRLDLLEMDIMDDYESEKTKSPDYKIKVSFFVGKDKISEKWINAFFELCFTEEGRKTLGVVFRDKINIRNINHLLEHREILEDVWDKKTGSYISKFKPKSYQKNTSAYSYSRSSKKKKKKKKKKGPILNKKNILTGMQFTPVFTKLLDL